MQALSILPSPPHSFLDSDDFAFASGSFHLDFSFKLKIDLHEDDENLEKQQQQEQEFSFACENPQGSLVTADEIFHNGKIRPLFPVFDGGDHASLPQKKLVVERRRDAFCSSWKPPQCAQQGTFQPLSLKTTTLEVEVEDSKDVCKKSNSTGFSKMLRFREDLKLRSYSDGKDAFVFLNPPPPPAAAAKKAKVVKNDAVVKNGKRKTAPSSSAHEKLYVMNRKRKESDKRRSFLPYKRQLFGFFANMNGSFSRNIHPF